MNDLDAESEVKVKVKFDYAHLAESILAESRDSEPSCSLGGSSGHTPLAPSDQLITKRHQRRTRFNTTCFDILTGWLSTVVW